MATRAALQLSPQERQFLEYHIIDGLPIYRAHQKAFKRFYDQRRGKQPVPTTSARLGRAILDRDTSQAYITELKEKLAERAEQQRFLSFDEKRAFLAKIVRTPIAEVDADHPIAQELTIRADGSQSVKIPSKLQALELDARIMGEFKDSMRLEVSEKVLEFAKNLV